MSAERQRRFFRVPSIFCRRDAAFWAPFVIALIPRVLYFFSWLDSPFRFYHQIYGLDMIKHARWAKAVADGAGFNSLYVFALGGLYKMAPGAKVPAIAAALQHLLGACSAGLTGYAAALVTRRPWVGVLAGCLYAVYGPPLVYEGALLKESFYATCCLALLVAAIKASTCRRRPNVALWVAGMTAPLPGLVRFAGLSWSVLAFLVTLATLWGTFSRKGLSLSRRAAALAKPTALFLGGALCVIGLTLWTNGGHLPGMTISAEQVRYVDEIGAKASPADPEATVTPLFAKHAAFSVGPLVRRAMTALGKLPSIFSVNELPNNLNYRFECQVIPVLGWLPGPLFLIPLGTAGLALSLLNRRRAARYGLLYAYLVALSTPMLFFLPLARYKVTLAPIFCVGAAFLLAGSIAFIRRKKWRVAWLFPATCAVSLGIGLWTRQPGNYRSEDLLAYAKGLEWINPDSAAIDRCLSMAACLDPNDFRVAAKIADRYLLAGKPEDALRAIRPFYPERANQFAVCFAMSACLLALNHPAEAKAVLTRHGEPGYNDEQRKRYYYNLGEACLLSGDNAAAAAHYRKALTYKVIPGLDKTLAARLELIAKASPPEPPKKR